MAGSTSAICAYKTAVALALSIGVASCTTAPYTRTGDARMNELIDAHVAAVDGAQRSLIVDPAIEDRVLALNPDRISETDVRTVLAGGPTPRIILVHGGFFPVYLLMESFAKFLVGMGYPVEKILDPHDGAYSQNPYGNSERIAGEVAWYYEHDGMRPMMIGHSQGGMQTVKVLHDLSGDYDSRIAVWNPVVDAPEQRYSILDPLTHRERPVVGVSMSFASVVGAGGVEFLAPTQWSLAGRLRAIPDSVDEFTGFSIAGDLVAWTPPSGPGAGDEYRNVGNAIVHNVNLPANYNHIFVPATQHLAGDPGMRAWINAYSVDNPPSPSTLPSGDSANVLWAANVWAGIKKHWCLEAQHLIRAQRGLDEGSRSQSAQR